MTKARTLADMISDGVIGTTELADDVITPVKLDETGNYQMAQLGIGTGTPQAELHLSTASTPEIRLTDTTNSVEANFFANDTLGTIGSKSNHAFAFNTNNTQRMSISSTGDVAINGDLTGLRYFDVYNTASGSTDGAVIRLITEQVGSTSTTSADIVKRKNGELRVSNFDQDPAAYIAFSIGTAERMKITSDGNVGIGTGSPDQELHIKVGNGGIISSGAAREGAVIRLEHDQQWESGYGGSGSDFLGALEFATGDTSTGVGVRAAIKTTVDSYYNTNSLVFYTAPAATAGILERMRLTTNGQLLLGTTSGTVYYNSVNTYNASAVIKTNLSNEIADLVITNGNNSFGSAVEFARTNTSGQDVRFASIVGVPTSNTAGSEAGDIVFKHKSTSTPNIVENVRFLADGGITFNGDTATANALDDYEEGTFTPSVTIGGATPAGLTVHSATCHYTKVGRVVTCTMGINATWSSSSTGDMRITGLPFTESRGGGYIEPGVAIGNKGTSNFTHAAVIASSNDLVCYKNDAPTSFHSSDFNNGGASGFWFHGTVVYHAT